VRAVVASGPGGPEVLSLGEVPDPEPGPGEVAIAVAATAVNRPDLLQRQGHYAPPPGASDVLGLECSGTIAAVGDDVTGWSVGDECCALLAGGGYAERVVCPAGQVMPVPGGVSLEEAASLPEVVCTVWSNVFMIAGLQPGEWILVHGGAGGIGSMAIQLAAAVGARPMTTAGSADKLEQCASLGAEVTIDYKQQDFVAEVMGATDGHGADVILDNMGASYLPRNVAALATEGRLLVIGLMGGTKAEIDLNQLMTKRGALISTRLRPRPVEEKAAICAAVVEHVWPLVADGRVRPVVSATLPLAEAGRAHALMMSGESSGKILLTVA
jgi:putative PIG3 family NAD(P)H quinone oxidoreductase